MYNILFLVETEYQLLLSSHLIFSQYSDKNRYSVTLIKHINRGRSRFKSPLDTTILSATVVELEVDYKVFLKDKFLKHRLEDIVSKKYDRFIHFLEHSPLGYFFSDRLFKKGTRICLCQDGLKPYGRIARFDMHARIKETLWIYVFLFSKRLWVRSFALVSFQKYGYRHQTKELLLTHPGSYNNWNNKKISSLDFYKEKRTLSMINKLFKFDPESANLSQKAVFYVNQPVSQLEDYEIKVLQNLRDRFVASKIYIKLHPHTSLYQIDCYKKIENVEIIDTTIPAELYIAKLHNAIVISGWSTSLLYGNETCNFFWLHPLYKKQRLIGNNLNIKNPTNHIQEIDEINKITFKSNL